MKKTLIKSRINNVYSIITIVSVFLLCIFSWLFYSEIIPVLWMYGEDVACSYKEYVSIMWDGLLCWEVFMNSVIRYFIFIFPVFPCFCSIAIIKELNSYHIFAAIRGETYRKQVLKSIVFYCVWAGLVTILPLVLLMFAVDYLMYPAVYSIGGIGTIFPQGFYYAHPMIVMLVMVLVYYLPLACSYALMAIGIALIDRDPLKMLVIPEVWYIVQNHLTIMSKGKIHTDTMDVLVAYNTSLSVGRLYETLIIQLVISLVVCYIGYYINKKRKILGI